MKFVTDEGLDKQVVELLRSKGHDVLYIAEFDSGANDASILDVLNIEMCQH